jgi:hypothetical protein
MTTTKVAEMYWRAPTTADHGTFGHASGQENLTNQKPMGADLQPRHTVQFKRSMETLERDPHRSRLSRLAVNYAHK